MRITRGQIRRIIREAMRDRHGRVGGGGSYGEDYLSRTHRGGHGEEADPRLDYVGEQDMVETEEEELLDEFGVPDLLGGLAGMSTDDVLEDDEELTEDDGDLEEDQATCGK